ncbi:MAG: hypothetical protein KDA75_14125 [Planctomycetaceae bacterium]|nr:hypothetical protein [Planctomycetaceae bacterium]
MASTFEGGPAANAAGGSTSSPPVADQMEADVKSSVSCMTLLNGRMQLTDYVYKRLDRAAVVLQGRLCY